MAVHGGTLQYMTRFAQGGGACPFGCAFESTAFADRQLALMNFSIEAGILLRGNGVPHAMLDIYVLFARGLPDAFVSQPTQLPHSYTHTRS